jgi:hypothetical protein
MRVINGHDYYDNAHGGIDRTIVFVRTETKIIENHPFTREYGTPDGAFHIILAGKVTPGVLLYVNNVMDIHNIEHANRTVCCYSKAEAVAYQTKNYGVFARKSTMAHFDRQSSVWEPWLAENGIVTGVVTYDRYNNHGCLLANTATLKDWEFFKIVDPWTTNMEIANYVGGVLPGVSNKMIKLTNKDRIKKAGFDLKSSFRHPVNAKKKK